MVAGLVVATRRKGDGPVFALLEGGRGKLECAFFNEAASEFAPLLVRDRILLVEGGLREDEFNGGFSLRARRAWDYEQLCMQAAQRLSLRLDLRVQGAFAGVDALLGQHRPGKTPLRFDLLRDGAAGTLDLNGSHGVRAAPDLVAALRRQPGVEAVSLTLTRPWTQ